MYEVLIKEYLKRMSLKDINDFALKNEITLKPGEDKILYDFVKENWQVIYKGDPTDVFNELKKKVSKETFDSGIKLYKDLKSKLKGN